MPSNPAPAMPPSIPVLEARTVQWVDEIACADAARSLAARPALRHAYVELHGHLGAGKTTFVRHLLRALGVTGNIKSPTYAVLEPYALSGPHAPELNIWHFDFYRFNDPQEFEDAGFREVFASTGLKLAEWADRAAPLLPRFDLRIDIALLDSAADALIDAASAAPIESTDTRRRVRYQAGTPRGMELLP
jgi:tRNA threonylcarbamoyladenosine biosynthesis protein TsaE